MKDDSSRRRQTEVYVRGVSGDAPAVPVAYRELERQAEAVMSAEAFAYIAGGAGVESTMAANHHSFDRWNIVPRMLRNVETRDPSIELFGRRLAYPFLLAPIGVLEMAHPKADLAVARAAAAEGVPMIFSSQASRSMEECSAAMADAPRWFQLYWSRSNALVESFVQRAEACGCEAIVLTLDTTMLGWRPRDLDLAYLPFLRGKGLAQYLSDPVFMADLSLPDGAPAPPKGRTNLAAVLTFLELARAFPEPFLKNLTSGRPLAAVRKFISTYSRPSLTWDDLPFLRQLTQLPILLKGIQHADDARRAIDHGMDGLIVSNHGGRQVDGAVGSLDALPAIAEVVGGQIPILFDSGIRGGADAFKALALGARAVCLGRPYVYGLAIDGERGVRQVLQNLKAEFDLTLGLAGCRSISEVTAEVLVPSR